MDLISILFIFIFGTLIGSFINVVALRYNTGQSIVSGGSKCFNCNTPLKWFELFPIISFLYLRGKCRTCQSSISKQYPIVEFLTGIVFVLVALRQYRLWPLYSGFSDGLMYSLLFFLFYSFVFSLLLAIGLYDIKHKIIPDGFVYTFIVLSLGKLALFFYCNNFILSTKDLFDLSAPFVLFVFFASMWLFSKGTWMGFGDAKLVFGIGALLGFVSGISAVILGFWLGTLWVIVMFLIQKLQKNTGQSLSFRSEIPFAPFLIAGAIIIFFTRFDLLNIGDFLNLVY